MTKVHGISDYSWLLPNQTILDFVRTSPELTPTHLDSRTCETLVLIIFVKSSPTGWISLDIVPNHNLFPVNKRSKVSDIPTVLA